MFKHIRNKIIFSYFLVLLSCFAVVLITTSVFLRRTYFSYALKDLKDDAGLFVDELTKEAIARKDADFLRKVLAKAEEGYIVDILDDKGVILGNSRGLGISNAQDINEEEFKGISSQGYGYAIRKDSSLIKSVYVVIPIMRENKRMGFIRISTPLIYIEKTIGRLRAYVIAIFFTAAGFSSLVSLILARNLSTPLLEMANAARKISSGSLDGRVDIKKRKDEMGLLADAFNEMIARLRSAHEERKNILSNISHELLTPITNIRGFSETLYDGKIRDKKEIDECIEIIKKESAYLESLIEELRLAARLDSLAMRYDFKPLDIKEVILDAQKALSLKAQEKEVRIKNSFMENCPLVTADYKALRQVFINLLDNAVKYSYPGQEVLCSLRRLDKFLQVTIQDRGPGIAGRDREKIFQRFYRIEDESRPVKGLGLGLSIVKEIVLSHQGRVEVESQPRQGAAFILTFPIG